MMSHGLHIQFVTCNLRIRQFFEFGKPAVVIDMRVRKKDVFQV